MKLTFLSCWILALAVTGEQNLRNPAFCTSSPATTSRSFPTEPPDAPYLPWIWDVVYDPNRLVVEITSVSRKACKVNTTQWQEITQLYPEFQDQLADGDKRNILATPGEKTFDFVGASRPRQGILGKTVSCVYFATDGHVIHKLRSHVVYSAWAWANIGPLLIRCPVPSSLRYPDSLLPRFDRIAIEREPPMEFTIESSARWKNRTLPLPFCRIPYIKKGNNQSNRLHKLSICTTAQRPDVEHLIEWIEYHLLQGFEHFFIYNTGIMDEAVTRDHSRKQ